MRYVIAYDIRSSRRRSKVLATIRNFGISAQYSVLECDLAPSTLEVLRAALLKLCDPRKDRVHFYPLCASCQRRAEVYGPSLMGGLLGV